MSVERLQKAPSQQLEIAIYLFFYNALHPFIPLSALFIDPLWNKFLAETKIQCALNKVNE